MLGIRYFLQLFIPRYVDLAHALGNKDAFLLLQKAGLTYDIFSREDIEVLPPFSLQNVMTILFM